MSNQRKHLETQYLALLELERRQREAPLLQYQRRKKHPKQLKFHHAGARYRRRLLLGGNRSGKTFCGGAESIAHAYGYRFYDVPDLRLQDGDLPPRDQIPSQYWIRRVDGIPLRVPNVGMAVSGLPRARGIGQVLHPSIYELLPAHVRKSCSQTKGALGVVDKLQLPNGSTIHFATAEQDDLSFEGFALDWAWVDEPVRQAVYSGLWRSLVQTLGPIWFTLTPLGARCAWLYNSMYLAPPDDVFVIEVCQRDNPFLTEQQIKEFEDNGEFSERERAARLYGRFEFLGDRVFDNFDPQVHIIKPFNIPDGWLRGITADPHHRRPAFFAWWAFDPNSGTYYFIREWPNVPFHKLRGGGQTPGEYAQLIRNIEGRHEHKIRVCDPRFGKAEHVRHGYHETCWVELMAEYGLEFDANVPNTGNLDYGYSRITDLLRYDKNFPIGPTNQPRILVFDCCENIANAFLQHGYLDVEDPVKGLFKKVSEEFKDPIDTVRYTILYPLPVTDEELEDLQSPFLENLRKENESAEWFEPSQF